MKLIVILGDSAVGKMTVGQELVKITNLKLFHNHLIIEPVLEVFDEFKSNLIFDIRKLFFKEFIKTDKEGLIFTYMMAFNIKEDWETLDKLTNIFSEINAPIYYIELVTTKEERIKRNQSENRLNHKKSKRDVKSSLQRMLSDNQKYRLVSFEGEVTFKNYIKIDNTNISASEVAVIIKNKFNL